MNLTRKMICALVITTLVASSGRSASADEPAQQISSANQALQAGDFEEALQQYDMAEAMMPGSPLLAYNKGVAHYRQGQIDQARHLFTSALDTTKPELAAKASFNLGNCEFATAVQQSETDRAAAIESLQTAIAHYRSALQSNSSDTDARANIELAHQLSQKLEKEEEQQQQDQQDQEQQQQDQDDQSQSENGKPDEQESEDPQSDEQSSEQNESESDETESDDTKSDESESDESKSGEPKEDSTAEQDSSGSDSEEAKEEPSEQQNESGSGSEEQQQERQPQDQEPVPQPADEQPEEQPEQQSQQPMQAGQPGAEDQQTDAQRVPGYSISQQGDPGENIDKEEAMKMLQAIRDRDLLRRMKKLDETRRRHRPVDRDW